MGINKCIRTLQPSEELVLGVKVWAPESGDQASNFEFIMSAAPLRLTYFLGPGFPFEMKTIEFPSEDC